MCRGDSTHTYHWNRGNIMYFQNIGPLFPISSVNISYKIEGFRKMAWLTIRIKFNFCIRHCVQEIPKWIIKKVCSEILIYNHFILLKLKEEHALSHSRLTDTTRLKFPLLHIRHTQRVWVCVWWCTYKKTNSYLSNHIYWDFI